MAVAIYLPLTAAALAAIVLGFGLPHVDASWLISLGALLAVSAVAHAARIRSPGSSFDASFAVELCALVVVGPIGAFVVAFVPAFGSRVIRRYAPFSDRSAADLAAIAGECLVGAAVLTTAPQATTAISAVPALFTAGMSMLLVGYVVSPMLLGTIHRGRAGLDFHPFLTALPHELAIVLCGVLVSLASGPLGPLALVGFLLAVPIPSLLVGELTRFKAADLIDRSTARRTYARALADELELPRRERRALEATLDLLGGDSPAHAAASTVDLTEAFLYRGERWDGEGDVAGLSGEWIPRVARVIAVADAWSELTAAGTPALEHDEALLGLATGAGTRFDPEVVEAAARVVATEAPIAHQPAFLPRLHTVPAPRALRRNVLPRVLQAVAGD